MKWWLDDIMTGCPSVNNLIINSLWYADHLRSKNKHQFLPSVPKISKLGWRLGQNQFNNVWYISCFCDDAMLQCRVERDEYRRPETYAVREEFSLFLICWVEREKLLFLSFESGFDDAMNMENDNINNSLECLKWSKHHKTEVLIHNF